MYDACSHPLIVLTQEFALSVNLGDLDSVVFKHTPYVILLLQARRKWLNEVCRARFVGVMIGVVA